MQIWWEKQTSFKKIVPTPKPHFWPPKYQMSYRDFFYLLETGNIEYLIVFSFFSSSKNINFKNNNQLIKTLLNANVKQNIHVPCWSLNSLVAFKMPNIIFYSFIFQTK